MHRADAPASDVAFSPSVKAAQTKRGSRAAYAKMEAGEGWAREITPDLESFLAEQDSFFFATASADGRPYVQHRGGPKGFVRVTGERTLAFADFSGNKQYISVGNLAENDRVMLFFMDYAHRRRVKVWGRAKVIEGDRARLGELMPTGVRAKGERVIEVTVEAWDVNCPQHIPQKLDAVDVKAALDKLGARVRELEEENRALRAATGSS